MDNKKITFLNAKKMPYRKRRFYKKRPYRTYKKKTGTNWMNVAKRALSTAMFVKNLVNAETKYHDTQMNPSPNNGTWLSNVLNYIPQGTTSTTRNGDSVKNKTLIIRGTVDINSTHPFTTPYHCRMVLIKMKNAQTSPNFSEMWLYPSDFNTGRHPNYIKQYKIIHDKKFIINNEDGKRSYIINWSFPLKSHTEYNTSASLIAQNAYYLCFWSDAQTLHAPVFKLLSKITFLDN